MRSGTSLNNTFVGKKRSFGKGEKYFIFLAEINSGGK